MVNSASQALAEFKNQRLGTLLGGGGSTVDPGPIASNGMATAQERLARNAPKKSSTAFLNDIRDYGKRTNDLLMQSIQNKRQAELQRQQQMMRQQRAGGGGSASYRLPGGGGSSKSTGRGGAFGLSVPAGNALLQLSAAYQKHFGRPISVTEGGRTYERQAQLYALYKAGKGNLAAKPGTSLHETGIAVDLGGGVQNKNSAQHAWLRQNAAQFGWYWVGQRYGEPWHWEYHPEWGR